MRHILWTIFAMAPAVLMAQETATTPAPAVEQKPAMADNGTLKCDDAALEAELAGLKGQAQAGDADAAWTLCERYAAKRHFTQARAWCARFERILVQQAESGNVETMCRLGQIYLTGQGYIEQDFEKATEWITLASGKGNPYASFALGNLLEQKGDKEGCAEAYKKAYAGFAESAAAGDAHAICLQGIMQFNGQGVERNAAEGVAKLELAAGKGSLPAAEKLAYIYVTGEAVPADKARALQYIRMCADNTGDGRMANMAAYMYLKGDGVPADTDLGMKYLKMAAEANVVEAVMHYAFQLRDVQGKPEEAFHYFRQGASMGLVPCMTVAGCALLHGEAGQEKDEAEAVKLLQRAAGLWQSCESDFERSHAAVAAYELAKYYEDSDESALAAHWYAIASDQGHPEALAKRGWLHLNPFSDLTWSPTLAYQYWKAGANAGNETCSLYINIFYFVFIPMLVVLVYGVPTIIIYRLYKRRKLSKAGAAQKDEKEV